MEELFIYLLKSAGVLSIFVLIYHFLLRKLTFFKANRFFLLFGLLASIVFPLIEITQTVYVEQPQMILLPEQMPTVFEQPPVQESIIDGGQLLMMLYAAISLFLLGKMAVELLSLRRLILSGKRRMEDGFVRISLSRKVTPFSFFNYICFNEQDEQDLANDLILKHEQVHAREWHSVDLLITHVYCALFWVNPLAWLLKRQIGENLEFIADATAKVQNNTGISYERTLLSSAASHMQPALANNFFTPFIKKRIQMLQKETSKTWNAYKYALILPVIVLFLYSFNTVTKTEYVKRKVNTAASAKSANESLMFDITQSTTQNQLNKYADKINAFADFKIQLKMIKTSAGANAVELFSAFGKNEMFKNFSMNIVDEHLLLLEVSKNQARLNNTATNETITIDKKGTSVNTEPSWLYNATNQTPGQRTTTSTFDEIKTISIQILPSTTEAELNQHKQFLKEEHNVDLKIENLKYKNGKIISINISLNDNRGFKGSQNYKSTEPIDAICITGIIDGNSKSWNMGSCDRVSGSNNAVYYSSGSSPMDESILDSLRMTMRKFKLINMDSLSRVLKLDLKKIDMDSLRSSFMTIRKLNLDSISSFRNIARGRAFERLDSTQYDNLSRRFVSDSVIFADGEDIYAYQPKYLTKTLNGGNPPLIILNGKEFKGDMEDIDPYTIESINILKDEFATSLYGDKGKNGVVLITLKTKGMAFINTNGSFIVVDSTSAGKVHVTNFANGKIIKTSEKLDLPENTYIILDGKPSSKEDLENVNLNRIESMTVLKGKEATSLYGEKAADGAIIIVTKVSGGRNYTTNTRSTTTSSSVTKSFYSIMIDTFTDEEFDKLKKSLNKEGYDFNLRTLRKTGNKVTKLKFDLDGTAYTFEPNTGMKTLTVTIDDKDKKPKVSAVSY